MKKEILAEASKSRTFGFSRVEAGVFPIVKLASYNRTATNTRSSESFEYEVLAVFFDADETVLELNGLHKSRPALNEDGTPGTHPVKASGTFLDKLFGAVSGKSYFDACAYFNDPANGFVGKFVTVEWQAYRSAGADYSGYSYLPIVNLFDTKEEAEASMKAE